MLPHRLAHKMQRERYYHFALEMNRRERYLAHQALFHLTGDYSVRSLKKQMKKASDIFADASVKHNLGQSNPALALGSSPSRKARDHSAPVRRSKDLDLVIDPIFLALLSGPRQVELPREFFEVFSPGFKPAPVFHLSNSFFAALFSGIGPDTTYALHDSRYGIVLLRDGLENFSKGYVICHEQMHHAQSKADQKRVKKSKQALACRINEAMTDLYLYQALQPSDVLDRVLHAAFFLDRYLPGANPKELAYLHASALFYDLNKEVSNLSSAWEKSANEANAAHDARAFAVLERVIS